MRALERRSGSPRRAARELLRGGRAAGDPGPAGVAIDSREARPGALFVGLRGRARRRRRARGGGARRRGLGRARRPRARARGGARRPAPAARCSRTRTRCAALQALARAWREELRARGAKVIAVTGSTGKTSTKDILAALLAPAQRTPRVRRTSTPRSGCRWRCSRRPGAPRCWCSRWRCAARADRRADRDRRPRRRRDRQRRPGPPRAAGLARGDRRREGRADRRAATGASVVVPAGEPLLAPHLRAELETITFGDGRRCATARALADGLVLIDDAGARSSCDPLRAGSPAEQPARGGGRRAARSATRPQRAARGLLLGDARTARRRCPEGSCDRRLLQRQPDVDARRDRDLPRRRPGARCRARRHARAGPRKAPACTARSVSTPAPVASSCWWPSGPLAAGIAEGFGGEVAGSCPTPTRPASWWRAAARAATPCW